MRTVLGLLSAIGILGATKVSLDLAALLVALGAIGTGLYNFWKVRQSRPLVGSEIEDRAVARMRTAMDAYAEDNKRLRAEVAQLEAREKELVLEVRACRGRIDFLVSKMRQAGVPVD